MTNNTLDHIVFVPKETRPPVEIDFTQYFPTKFDCDRLVELWRQLV
jgi:hypothetical protein